MCYISMNREDGFASPEVVHESLVDEMFTTSLFCPRCKELDLEIDAAQDAHEGWLNSPNLADSDDGAFSETIRY